MKIIEMQAPEIWEQKPGFVGMCEHIARCAAVCYDSVPKEGGAAVDFVRKLIKMGHGRPLEFGTVVYPGGGKLHQAFWTQLRASDWPDGFAETNLRELLDSGIPLDEVEGGCIDLAPIRLTIHYPALSRGIADELRTHITLSSLMRSTRYVDAGKGGEVEFVRPYWLNNAAELEQLKRALYDAEQSYKTLLASGRKKQEAREVLPLCVKTELVQCGFPAAWGNLVRQRTGAGAHPDARWLAQKVDGLIMTRYKEEEK